MAFNFVKYISDNWDADATTKQQFLDDFCAEHGYDESGSETKTEFANRVIKRFIKGSVDAYRANEARKKATYNELILE